MTLSEAADLLEETSAHLDGIQGEVKDGRPPLYRAGSAAASGRVLLALADPKTTPKAVATQVRNKAQQLRDNVAQAAGSGGASGGTIDGPAEEFLTALIQLRQPGAPVEEKAKEAARRFSQSLGPRIRAIESEVEQLGTRLSELSESANTEANATSERLDTLKGEIENTETRVGELISDQDSKFTEAQEKRREEHAKVISEAGDRLDDAAEAFEQRKDEATGRLDKIEQEVAEAAAKIGASTAAVDHGAENVRQTKLAFRWTLATLGLLVGASLVSIFVLGILKADQSPESVAGKITVVLVLAGVAGYAGGLAHHHRERAANARRLEIEMNAFGPFIEPLDRHERNDLRSTAVWRFFGPNTAAQEPDGDPRPGPRITELLHQRRAKRKAHRKQEGPPNGGA